MNPVAVWQDFLFALKDRDFHSAADFAQTLLNLYAADCVTPRFVGNRHLPGPKGAKEMLTAFRRLYSLAEGFEV